MAQLTTTTAGRAEGEAGPDRRFPPKDRAFAFDGAAGSGAGGGQYRSMHAIGWGSVGRSIDPEGSGDGDSRSRRVGGLDRSAGSMEPTAAAAPWIRELT